MFAKRLTYDHWVGNRDQGASVDSPAWTAIEERIARLDAKQHTMVTLSGQGEAHLAIGGGGGGYIVYETRDNMEFHNLVEPARGDAPRTVTAGGQAGEYPARQVVSLQSALAAAREYAETGRLSDAVQWEDG